MAQRNNDDRKYDEDEERPSFRSLAHQPVAQPPTFGGSGASGDFMAHLNRASERNDISANTFNGDQPPVYRSVQLQSAAPAANPFAGGPQGPAAAAAAQYRSAGVQDLPMTPAHMQLTREAIGRGVGYGGEGPTMAVPSLPKPTFRPAGAAAVTGAQTTAAAPGELVVPRLPGAPFPVERTHFRSNRAPEEVAARVTALLKARPVAAEFKPGKAKWKASFTENHCHVVLRVRLFADPAKRGLLVEFQRRAGDLSAFMRLFRWARAEMARERFVVDEAGATVGPEAFPSPPARVGGANGLMAPPSLGALAPPALSRAGAAAALRPLAEMAASERLDTQLEAVRALARATDGGHAENIGAVCDTEGLVRLLARHLASDSGDVRRAACAALANLAAGGNAEQAASVAGVEGIASALVSTVGAGADIDTQRAAARALAALTASPQFAQLTLATERARIDQLKTMHVEDELLRAEAQKAFTNLEAVMSK